MASERDEILPTTIAALAPRMLHRFRARVERAESQIARLPQDRLALERWESITKKGCVFGNLTPDEQAAVRDALHTESD